MSRIHIARDRQPLGQFDPEEVAEGLKSGRFLPTDLAWREGMAAWEPLSTFADLPSASGPAETPPDLTPLIAPGAEVLEPGSAVTTGEGFPWERRTEIGVFSAFFQTIFQSLGSPAAAFSRLSRTPSILAAYLFYLPLAMVSFAIYSIGVILMFQSILNMVSTNPELAADPDTAEALAAFQEVGVFGMAIWFAFVVIVITPCLPFVVAGVVHLLLALFGGAKESFFATLATVCYVFGAATPLAIVPCCGNLVMTVWFMVSGSIALATVHRTETWRASFAVVLPFVLCCTGYFAINMLTTISSLSGMNTP